jgi:putative FmdB family regulatory protein
MPTYDYICDSCKWSFELFQSITAKPVRLCPKCGKKKVKRLIGAGAGVIFKGSGFYETDYRSEGYKKAAESEKKTTDKETGKKDTETKTTETKSQESKPDKKSEPKAKEKKKTA